MDVKVVIRNDEGDTPLVSIAVAPVTNSPAETELEAVHGAIVSAGMGAMVSAGFNIGQVKDVWGKAKS